MGRWVIETRKRKKKIVNPLATSIGFFPQNKLVVNQKEGTVATSNIRHRMEDVSFYVVLRNK